MACTTHIWAWASARTDRATNFSRGVQFRVHSTPPHFHFAIAQTHTFEAQTERKSSRLCASRLCYGANREPCACGRKCGRVAPVRTPHIQLSCVKRAHLQIFRCESFWCVQFHHSCTHWAMRCRNDSRFMRCLLLVKLYYVQL